MKKILLFVLLLTMISISSLNIRAAGTPGDTFTIHYELNGGLNSLSNPTTFTNLDTDITLEDATRTNYVFMGWFESFEFLATTEVSTIDTDTLHDIYLYAKWEDQTIDISLELDETPGVDDVFNVHKIIPTFTTVEENVISLTNPSFIIQAYDFNYDGYDDFIYGDDSVKKVYVNLNDQNGGFTQVEVFTMTGAYVTNTSWFPWDFIFDDLNNDGIGDISYVDNYGVYLIVNNGDGTFETPVRLRFNGALSGYSSIAVDYADINNDGFIDIALGGSGTQYFALGDGTSNFGALQTFSTVSSYTRVAQFLDYNGDGFEDLYFSNGSSYSFKLGNGDGTFSSTTLTGGYTSGYRTAVEDYDNDGKEELIVIGSYIYRYEFVDETTKNQTFIKSNTTMTFDMFDQRDINNDGYEDFVYVTGGKNIEVVMNNYGGISQTYKYTSTSNYVGAMFADFNNDGISEIYGANDSTGQLVKIATYALSYEIPTYPTPTRSGYTFDGWFTDSALQNAFDTSQAATQNTTLYAGWSLISHDVIFNANYGVGTMTSQTIGEALADNLKANEFTRTGYTFTGWNTAANGTGTAYDDEDLITMGQTDITLYAQWTVNQYTITFNANGGSQIDPITLDYGTAVTTPANPSREGYTFTGWDQAIPSTMPAEDLTITPAYNINSYTITFNSNGGSSVSDLTQYYSISLNAPEDPTKEGYTFRGWYSDSQLTTAYAFTTMPANNQTLYAKWSINTYSFTVQNWDETTMQYDEFDFETDLSSYTLPYGFSRTGYTFAGWDIVVPATMPAEDLTITALWTINQYNLNFNTDGGSAIDSVVQDYDSSITLPDDPTKTGYTFTGWLYLNDDEDYVALDIDAMPARDLTLYAQWEISAFTVSYNVDGIVTTETVNVGASLQNIPTPTKDGFTFVEWQIDGVAVDLSTYIQNTSDVEIVAVFKDNVAPTIEVTLPDGSKVTSDTIVSYEVGSYVEPTSATTDNADSNLSAEVVSTVVANVLGSYTITYTTTDTAGNQNVVVIDVIIEDTTAPELDILVESISLNHGQDFSDAIDQIVEAQDNYSEVSITATPLEISGPGTYTLTIFATDSSGNVTTDTINVVVEPNYVPYVAILVLGLISIAATIIVSKRG